MKNTATVSTPENGTTQRATFRVFFHNLACRSCILAGTPWAFLLAVIIIVLWLCTGPLFHFSDTWQLIINTGTTVVTFLMVFLIQNTQNREMKALQLKLDELLRGVKGARTSLVNLEELTDEELDRLKEEFRKMSERRRPTEHHSEHKHADQAA